MMDVQLDTNDVLLVASRGTEARHGLWRWDNRGGSWRGEQLGTVRQLSALAGHPTLPVVYGTAGIDDEGTLHAWRIDTGGCTELGAKSSEGAEPCHLVVDPSGRLLIVTNYTTSTLALQPLGPDGAFDGPLSLLKLSGGGPEIERQDDAHPHQAFFHGDTLIVIDLGADLIREFAVDPAQTGTAALRELRQTAVRAGAGPRHGVVLPDGRLAVSGELGSNLLVGRPGDTVADWADVPSTTRTGPAKTRHTRNYPGDIQRSADGRHVYFANRSHDTLATFDASGPVPALVAETDTTVAWPQHILVHGPHLLVAGWDSGRVVALPTDGGVPTGALPLLDCEGAGWLHLHRLGPAG